VREAFPFVLLACACGAALREPLPGLESAPRAAAPQPHDLEARAAFDALSARAEVLAPGMRETARKESGGEQVEIVRAREHDVCVRIAFEASAPVIAKLLDGAGGLLAESSAPAREGVLGEKGPVCVRKGDAVACAAENGDAGDADTDVDTGARTPGHAKVRWVAWEAP
jgi:hypothetical protein